MPYVHRYIGPICRIWGRAHHFKLGVDSELYRLQSTILHTCTEASPDQHTLATPAFAPAVVPGPLQRHPWTAEPADSAEPHQSAVRLFRLTLLLFSHSHSHFFLSDSFFLFISLSLQRPRFSLVIPRICLLILGYPLEFKTALSLPCLRLFYSVPVGFRFRPHSCSAPQYLGFCYIRLTAALHCYRWFDFLLLPTATTKINIRNFHYVW